jgi:hypothetical protein
MAHPTDNGQPTNPHVRAEHTDADVRAIVKGGLYLGVCLTAAAVLTLALSYAMSRYLGGERKSDQATARGEDAGNRPLPNPPLEALEDLRDREKKNTDIYPLRAAEYYAPQVADLRRLDPIKGTAGAEKRLFTARKDGGKGPTIYGVALPSRASAGQTVTGGQ